jgi:glycine/D-amino acid oxidase-like deaminating enzyme/nitrite reductase/ring-hydroxylating ferredoxin subunit
MTSNTSLWIATTTSPSFQSLQGDIRVDVAVVGAGISGLTAAILLKERGKTVAVIEKDGILRGETGHTTAHLTEAVDARYHTIRKDFGREAARLVADASRSSIEQIDAFIRQHNIRCRFRRLPGFLYTEKRRDVAGLKSEAVSASEAGVAAKWVTDVPLPFRTRGAVRFENQAQFHPREYLIALAAKIEGNGSRIFEKTKVVRVEEGDQCVIETESGTIRADSVFVAANVPVNDRFFIHTKLAAYRSYAIALDSGNDHADALFWDTEDPYHYTRWQETDAGRFLIVGGEDHKVGEEDDTEGCYSDLQDYVREKFGATNLRYRWSGQIIEPVDGLPYIGRNTNSEKAYVATGYAGQGMTFGTVAGMIVADLIAGRSNPWADLFDATRVKVKGAIRDYLSENVDYPKHMILDRVISRDVEGTSASAVAPGEGKIVSVDGKKVALYRSDDGTVRALSPVCPHMGCDVAWNNAERTWDCPCHGSRFTPEGRVVNGPATSDLEPVDV